MDCTVIDYSARGACIEVHGAAAIPKRFFFVHGMSKTQSRLVWQKGRRVGIAF